ncbi:DUF1963 domain-containing protein [Lentzea sp.]|uniref:DUF1963 domain-containing protein n=1 Tax=Lentzea sp. TaxID=56099 RepID=UPI002ED2C131
MNRYEQFRQTAIDRGVPEDEAGRFAEHLRFAVWTDEARDGEEVVGQLGGLPRLPAGTEWPGALPFIGSVDCAALPLAEGLPLPADGSLLFFLHHEEDMEAVEDNDGESDYSLVLHVPAGVETEVVASPRDPGSTTHFMEPLPFLLPERRITAWVQPELPRWLENRDAEHQPDAVKELLDELKHVEQLRDLVGELWPAPGRGSSLRFGGYCSEHGSSDGPFTQMANGSDEQRLVREWAVLAQFDTQSEFYYGCFLITLEDLAAQRFEAMRSFTMFTE